VSEELGAIPDQVLASWEGQEGESMREGHAATLKRLIGEALDRAYRLGQNAGLEKGFKTGTKAIWTQANRLMDLVPSDDELWKAWALERSLKSGVSDGE
jgi:hypothetical protein